MMIVVSPCKDGLLRQRGQEEVDSVCAAVDLGSQDTTIRLPKHEKPSRAAREKGREADSRGGLRAARQSRTIFENKGGP